MKKYSIFVVICTLIVLTPFGTTTAHDDHSNQIKPIDETILAAKIERIYGVDYSNEVFNRVSLSSFRNFIIELTENGSREYVNPADLESNNIVARDWIADKLVEVSNGRIEVEILGDYNSVLGRLQGYLPVDGPAFLVGGHFDSVPDAPGANDDATGIATALELARVLSGYEWPIDIYFGAWNAEEIGLRGSREVAGILSDRGVDILLYYNIDMLLVPHPYALSDSKLWMGYQTGTYQDGLYWADLTRAMSKNYGFHMIKPIELNDLAGGYSSDHASFIAEGYPSLLATETGFTIDTAYHSPSDVWNNPLYNYTVAIEAVKAIGASIAFTLARAYQEPRVVVDEFILQQGRENTYAIVITTPTTINVSCRWWGGGTRITLTDTLGWQLAQIENPVPSPWESTLILSQSVAMQGIYTLSVFNPSETSIGYELEITYETDIDDNDVPDSQEFWFDQEFFSMDSDLDTINDGQEMIVGTSRFSNDTDSDSMSDSWEIQHGLDPLNANDAQLDEDSDGLSNLEEFLNHCDPNSEDTDADSMPDLWEVENYLNPTLNDSAEDPDQDGVSNLREYLEKTDPHFPEFRVGSYLVPAIILGAIAIIAIGVFVVRHES